MIVRLSLKKKKNFKQKKLSFPPSQEAIPRQPSDGTPGSPIGGSLAAWKGVLPLEAADFSAKVKMPRTVGSTAPRARPSGGLPAWKGKHPLEAAEFFCQGDNEPDCRGNGVPPAWDWLPSRPEARVNPRV